MEPSFMERLRPYLDQARQYGERAGVHLRRAWAWIREASVRAGRATERVSRRWYASASAWMAERRRRRAERAPRSSQQEETAQPRRSARSGVLSPEAAIVVARPEDDLATITGRLDTADDLEVALVVPRSARRLREPSVWPHIAAHARRRGVLVRVVSPRRDVRTHARANGLRSARRLRQLQRDGFRLGIGTYSIRLPGLPVGALVRFGAIAGVVVAAFWLVSFQLPSATVTIVPNAEEFSTTREVRLSPVIDSSDIETNMVRSGSVRETITTLITAETTGEVEVGEESASVTLLFTNESDEEVVIPAGASVTDEEETASFETAEEVEIPTGESREVGANAAAPGAAANVPANSLVMGEGLSDGVSVTNPGPAAGGTNQLVRAVHEDDMARVRSIADDVLREISERSLDEMLDDETVLFPDTLSTAIFSEVPLQQLEEPAEVLLVEYVIVVSAIVLDPSTLTGFGEEMIRADLPEGLSLLPDTTTVTPHDDAAAEAGQIEVTLEATGMVASVADFADLPEEIAGMRPAAAEALIAERLSLIGPPDIEINPSMVPWRWLPRSSDRIEVVLAGPSFFEEEEDEEEEPPDEEPFDEEPLEEFDPEELEPPTPGADDEPADNAAA